uniref:Phosducin domain-containing protein n=2 Tax=Nemorhina TaxID=44051 RepID=A0A1B0AQV4_9MUSC
MDGRTRTGLIPTPKQSRIIFKKQIFGSKELPKKFEASPMALSLRPLGGLYNPYAKTCSVLCNHPASPEIKQMINKCKQTLAIEGKNVQHLYDAVSKKALIDTVENIPEDLFRRYTDTDSRPLTPTPTVTSVHTRTSAGSFLNNRRCITPEFSKTEIIKRKKLILDLRKSHSQETLYWKPTSDFSYSTLSVNTEEMQKARSAGALEEHKSKKPKMEETKRPKSCLAGTTESLSQDTKKIEHICINEQDFEDDSDIRRGKKRKRMKPITATVTPTATFHLSEDPETQVSALGPDSLNPSTRPSLIPNCANLLPNKNKLDSDQIPLKGSFLTEEAFRALKTDLDVDKIENTFEIFLNRALREAFKYLSNKPHTDKCISEEFKKLNVTNKKTPRKFSKSATRFEVPMNLATLEEISVFDYLSNYVWVTRQRKQIYKKIFLKYFKTKDHESDHETMQNDQTFPHSNYTERTIGLNHLPAALEDVLEFYGNEMNIKKILNLLDYENIKKKIKNINFRSWCGVVAFAERLAIDDPHGTDSCDEMATLEDKLLGEKLEYYCSSSEGEDEPICRAEEGNRKQQGARNKQQGPDGYLNADVCPPPPPSAGGYRYQGSTNTGPKGVVEDWQRFKKLQAEKREENERQRIELAKKLTMSTATAQEEEERKRQEEIDNELAELMSEDFLQQYQKQRMAEMLRQCGHNVQFGKVLHLTSHKEFLDCVENESKHTTIIIHIYERGLSACSTLNKCLEALASQYAMVKFAKICSSVAGMSREFRNKGLPALLVYKAQAVIGNFVRITDDLSDDFFESDVESFLIENGILIDKNLYN